MKKTTHPVKCNDGLTLEVMVHACAHPKAVIQINPATAVTERMYFPFAEHLVTQGFEVITYNYRGIAKNGPSAKEVQAGFVMWADQDIEAVTHWVGERYPHLPHLVIGHSFGGQAIGLCESSQRLHAVVMICSQAGCLRFIRPWQEWLRVAILLKVIGPLTARWMGYMPGRKLRIGEDLPANVMQEWARWTTLPNYFFDDPTLNAATRFARPRLPILSLGFNDDGWAPPEAIDLMMKYLTNCAIERRQFGPEDSHGKTIGHLDFFRPYHANTLWPVVTKWLNHQVARNTSP